MRIVVCIKAVKKSLIDSNSVGYIINPYDLYSLMCALTIKKEDNSAEIVCVLMGGKEIKSVINQCYALGADKVLWITDVKYAGSDTVATSYILSETIKSMEYDYIFCGKMAVDGETGQVPYGIAYRLNIPFFDNISRIIGVGSNSCIVLREDQNAEISVEIEAPSILIFNKFQIEYPTISLIKLNAAQKKGAKILNSANLQTDKNKCGIEGSKTQVLKMEKIMYRRENKLDVLTTVDESISLLVSFFNNVRRKQ